MTRRSPAWAGGEANRISQAQVVGAEASQPLLILTELGWPTSSGECRVQLTQWLP